MLASDNSEDQLGQNQIHLSCVDSTNNYAAILLKSGHSKPGTVILADEQTNGRGQRGSVWQSEPGLNLQFSAIWTPKNLSIQNQRFLNFAVGIALVRYLKKMEISAQIKWPNDILVEGNKISGILIENNLRGELISTAIIGIGMNVNQLEFENLIAASLKGVLKHNFIIQEVLEGVLFELNKMLKYIHENRFEELETLYFEHLFGYNVQLQFEDMNGLFRGEIVGVDESGKLLVLSDGEIKTYGLKELKFLF